MNKFRQFWQEHYGSSVELKYRMFCICAVLGTITSLLGAILCCIIAGFSQPVSYITIFGFIIMLTLTSLGHKTKKVDFILIIISSALNFIVFPIAFLTTGALYSVAPIFFVMGIFIAAPILNKRNRAVLFTLQLVFYVGVISLCFFYPELSYVRAQTVHTIMLMFSFIIVAFYTVFSTFLITNQYEKEQVKIQLLNALLEKQATMDPLTKLYNRRYLNEILIKQMQEENPDFMIIIGDIDDFKKVNDSLGHIIGDQVLVSLSSALTQVFPQDCVVCRYGGEEFVIYCNNSDIGLAKYRMGLVKKRFIQMCREQFSVAVTFSAGAAIYKGEKNIEELVSKADALLYEAKRNGKN